MVDRRVTSDLEPLDRLLEALGRGVGHRVRERTGGPTRALTVPEAIRAAWRKPAVPVQVATLPRGIPLDVVLRGVFRHFLPGAAAVILPLFTFLLLFNPFDWITNVPIPLGVLGSATAGFGMGLGALSRWLFPHSNPDGQRSDLAGLVSPLVTFVAAVGLFLIMGPLSTAGEFVAIWTVATLSGLTMAVVAYVPWLKPTTRIAPASPVKRWAMLRATVSMGVIGAGVFGLANLALWLVVDGLQLGWEGVAIMLMQGALRGFLIGVVFALILWWVYRRMPVDRLTAWQVGLWGAGAASIPAVTLVALRSLVWDVALSLPHPIVEFLLVFFGSSLPGYLLAFVAVKLAQRPEEGTE